MKIHSFLLALALLLAVIPAAPAADLPTVTIEHLYYLQSRADRVRKFKPDEMANYCLAQKIGGTAFEYMISQLFTMRIRLARLTQIQELSDDNPEVVALKKEIEVYTRLLNDEAAKVQDGLLREGQIAADALQAMAKAQQQSAR